MWVGGFWGGEVADYRKLTFRGEVYTILFVSIVIYSVFRYNVCYL